MHTRVWALNHAEKLSSLKPGLGFSKTFRMVLFSWICGQNNPKLEALVRVPTEIRSKPKVLEMKICFHKEMFPTNAIWRMPILNQIGGHKGSNQETLDLDPNRIKSKMKVHLFGFCLHIKVHCPRVKSNMPLFRMH